MLHEPTRGITLIILGNGALVNVWRRDRDDRRELK